MTLAVTLPFLPYAEQSFPTAKVPDRAITPPGSSLASWKYQTHLSAIRFWRPVSQTFSLYPPISVRFSCRLEWFAKI